MRKKFFTALALAAVLFLGTFLKEAECAAVRMRIIVLNPSATLTQTKTVRQALPKEVALQNVKDDGGLDIEYDNKEGAFVVFKNDISLEPGETKVFEVLMDDVWMLNEDKLETMRKRTEAIVKGMRDTKAYEKAALLSESMYARMDQIIRDQNNPNVTSNQHIAFYRDNLLIHEQLEKDMAQLEKMLVTAGGTVSLDAVENADLNVKGPDVKTTWIIIFVVLVFIGILGAVFYFTWQGQASSKDKDKAAPSGAFKENTPAP
jgi:hypothetical protein